MSSARILVVEDEAAQRELIAEILRGAGHVVREAGSVDEAERLIQEEVPDLILSDWRLPGRTGGDLLDLVRQGRFGSAFLVMTAYGSIAHAVEAIQRGADDYLAKPFQREALLLAVRRALKTRSLEEENRQLREQVSGEARFGQILGRAESMQRLYRTLSKVAATDATVLITGESGTGKELVARTLHGESTRSAGPFVAVNCGAIPESLIESELFGHERGAFTGAHRRREGKFEEARGGTLFLDEIASMPPAVQASLLRVLQERRICRVGGTGEVEVDVRVVAATNQELGAMAAAGEFRSDLYYRLNVVPVEIPPLRERREDIPLLASAFLEETARRHRREGVELPPAVLRSLMEHPWPGNVRELANVLERLVLLGEGGQIRLEDLPGEIRHPGEPGGESFRLPPDGLDWNRLETTLLQQALERTGGNRTAAARILGLGYKAFLYRLEKHGLA